MSDSRLKNISSVLSRSGIWIADKLEDKIRKKKARRGADTITNIERLHKLKERGVIEDKDFEEIKSRLLKEI